MSDGFQFLDIIFLAMVAGFIALRLRGALGRRTGHERPPREAEGRRRYEVDKKEDNVVSLEQVDTSGPTPTDEAKVSPLRQALTRIANADPSFSAEAFVDGARAAYRMIVAAFAEGDKKTLRGLLNDQVFDDFSAAIDQRAARNQTSMAEFEDDTKVDLIAAALNDGVAQVTVKFFSRLVRATLDADGDVVDGHPTLAREVTDIWTFSRRVQDQNPNWLLVSTRSAD